MPSEASRIGRQLVNYHTNEIEDLKNENLKSSVWRNYCGDDSGRALAEWGGLKSKAKLIEECEQALKELIEKVGKVPLEYYYLDDRNYLAVVFPDLKRVAMGYVNVNNLDSKEPLGSSIGKFRDYWRTPFSNYSNDQLGQLRLSLPGEKASVAARVPKYRCIHFIGMSRSVTASCEYEMTYQDHLDLGLLDGSAEF